MKTTPLSLSKVGDPLIYHGGGFSRQKSITKVDRLTKTKIVTKEGLFNRETGYAPRSGSYSPRGSVSIPIEGEIQRVKDENRHANLCFKLENVKWRSLSLPQLEQIAALLP